MELTNRPTQSILYVPLQINGFQKSVLLIVQYKYLKSYSGDFYSPGSDPPHKIMRYWFYYSIQLVFSFPPTTLVIWKCLIPQLYQFRRGISGGPALKKNNMIHRGVRWVLKRRECSGFARVNKVTSASLGYPLSVFNKNSTFRWARAKVFNCNKTSVGRAIAFGCATRCHLMMMIAFITFKSSLVPLFEGL